MPGFVFSLPKLPYEYTALEPVMSAEALKIHYTKHHQAYLDKLNDALSHCPKAETEGDLGALLSLNPSIAFNGGGFWNHSFFWKILSPQAKGKNGPQGPLAKGIEKTFESFDRFLEKFSSMANGLKGSGWAWLAYDPVTGQLVMLTTPNHGTLHSLGLVPLFVVDLWEHAYYLQYRNERSTYVKEIWKILNWKVIEENYSKALQ